jgi:hypothetical protein
MGRLIKFLFGTFAIIIAFISIGIGYLKIDTAYRQKSNEYRFCRKTPI